MGLEIIPLRSQAWVFFSDEDNTVQCFCKGLLSGKFISPLCSGPGLHATSELPNHWDVAHRCTPKVKVKSLSRVRFFATPWTVAYQVPPSMGFSRQECWSGLPFPSPGDLPNQGSNLGLPHCRQTLYHLSHQGSKPQTSQRIGKVLNLHCTKPCSPFSKMTLQKKITKIKIIFRYSLNDSHYKLLEFRIITLALKTLSIFPGQLPPCVGQDFWQ